MNHLNKVIDELDLTLDYLTKTNKWERLVNNLENNLMRKVGGFYKGAIKETLQYLNNNRNASNQELDEIENIVIKHLGKPISGRLKGTVRDYTYDAYKMGRNELLKTNYAFNTVDKQALNWLNKDFTYWIGQYYGNNLQLQMRESIGSIMDKGLSYKEAGKEMSDMLNDKYVKTKSYWEGLANHIATRSRVFGSVEGLTLAGADYYIYRATLDHRTSSICRYLDGRCFKVQKAVELRNKLLVETDPEKVKEISPWLNDKEAESKVKDVKSSKLALGFAFPPQHFNCRSIIQIASESEYLSDVGNKL